MVVREDEQCVSDRELEVVGRDRLDDVVADAGEPGIGRLRLFEPSGRLVDSAAQERRLLVRAYRLVARDAILDGCADAREEVVQPRERATFKPARTLERREGVVSLKARAAAFDGAKSARGARAVRCVHLRTARLRAAAVYLVEEQDEGVRRAVGNRADVLQRSEYPTASHGTLVGKR